MAYFVYLVTDRHGFFPLWRSQPLPSNQAFPGFGISLIGSFEDEGQARAVFRAAEELSKGAQSPSISRPTETVAYEGGVGNEDRPGAERRVTDRRGGEDRRAWERRSSH